jgi:hypothetical protein
MMMAWLRMISLEVIKKKWSYSEEDLNTKPGEFGKILDINCKSKEPRKFQGFCPEQLGKLQCNLLDMGNGKYGM